MIQKICDKCGCYIPSGAPESQWKGPEMYIELYREGNPFKSERIHLCNDCTKKLISWMVEG